MAIKEDFAAILALASVPLGRAAGRTHGEVDPVGSAALFEDELIEVATGAVGDVEQDASHADHLLGAVATDIDGAACQMVTSFGAAAKAIDLFGAVARRDYDGDRIPSRVQTPPSLP